MSERRIEVLKAAYDAWNRHEFDSFVEQGYREDAVWEAPEGDISSVTQRGRRTFAQAWESWESEEEWEDGPIWQVERIQELDRDRVLVHAIGRAPGKRSGIEVTRRAWHLYEYRGRKVARVRWFDLEHEALAAVQATPEPDGKVMANVRGSASSPSIYNGKTAHVSGVVSS